MDEDIPPCDRALHTVSQCIADAEMAWPENLAVSACPAAR
jgi:hypothetical protein